MMRETAVVRGTTWTISEITVDKPFAVGFMIPWPHPPAVGFVAHDAATGATQYLPVPRPTKRAPVAYDAFDWPGGGVALVPGPLPKGQRGRRAVDTDPFWLWKPGEAPVRHDNWQELATARPLVEALHGSPFYIAYLFSRPDSPERLWAQLRGGEDPPTLPLPVGKPYPLWWRSERVVAGPGFESLLEIASIADDGRPIGETVVLRGRPLKERGPAWEISFNRFVDAT